MKDRNLPCKVFLGSEKRIYTKDTVYVTMEDGSTLVGANGMTAKDDFLNILSIITQEISILKGFLKIKNNFHHHENACYWAHVRNKSGWFGYLLC
jgi:hypothetical protein